MPSDLPQTNGLFDGRYRILRRLGQGGMARVFLADDTELHRQVAIKVLADSYAEDGQFVERFAREARAAAGLNHPNIVQIYDRGQSGGSYYIAMEFLDGETLKDIIVREGPLPARRAIDLTLQFLAALRSAHRREIIHRDVKPHNIMVLRDGRVKVTDFGIARAGASEMTEAGSIVGTAQYLSPEQARGLPVGPEADIYSAGVVLYEMLTGRVPFTGDSAVAIAMKHVHEPPPPPRRFEPSIPPGLERIVLRALQKEPERRYRSADEMGMDLDRVRKGLGVAPATEAIAAGAFEAPGRTVISPPRYDEPRRREPPPPPPARKVWPWVLLIVLAIVAAALAFVILQGLGGNGGGGSTGTTATTAPTTTAVAAVTVPALVGLTEAEARAALESSGLKAPTLPRRIYTKSAPVGQVTAQDPAKGSQVPKGSTVSFTVSKGQNTVVVPDESGKTFSAASADLVALGFTAKRVNENNDTVPSGQVIAQDPAAGTAAPKGSEVQLKVSIGQSQVAVPNVVNRAEGDARAAINGAGLKVAKTEAPDESIAAGSVISQDPGPGAKVDPGATVNIVVSTGPAVISVPDETGKATADAQADLKKLGLLVKIAFVAVADPAQDGIVQTQDPAAGSSAKKGDSVTLQVGSQAAP